MCRLWEELGEQNLPHVSCTIAFTVTKDVDSCENLSLVFNPEGSRSNGAGGSSIVRFPALKYNSVLREAW